MASQPSFSAERMDTPAIELDDKREENEPQQGDRECRGDENVVALLRSKDESAILANAKSVVTRAGRSSGRDPAQLVRACVHTQSFSLLSPLHSLTLSTTPPAHAAGSVIQRRAHCMVLPWP